MITPEQIRAARAMLDLSTTDLAKLTGLTTNGINKIERGHVEPQKTTLNKIQQAFEYYGVEFLPGTGLRKKDHDIIVLKGAMAGRDLAKDMYDTLKDTGGEILIAYADEKKAAESLGETYLLEQIRQRAAVNISHRILCFEKNFYRLPNVPASTYRFLPEEYYCACPFFIYGPKLALYSTVLPQEVVIIHEERFAECLKGLFNFAWDIAGNKLHTSN